MIKKIILLLIMSGTNGFSQNFTFRFKTQLNTYDMKSLHTIQDQVVQYYREFDIPAKTVSSFPPFLGFRFEVLGFEEKTGKLGIFLGMGSTGGRVDYTDYSGRITFDQNVKYFSYGGLWELFFAQKVDQRWFLNVDLAFLKSALAVSENYRINNSKMRETAKFKSEGFGVGGALGFEHKLNQVWLGGEIGYQYTIPSKITLSTDKNTSLYDRNGKTAKMNWSGLRIGLFVSYDYKK